MFVKSLGRQQSNGGLGSGAIEIAMFLTVFGGNH
jgi:hypothetical protein